jgi:hypothetical protein
MDELLEKHFNKKLLNLPTPVQCMHMAVVEAEDRLFADSFIQPPKLIALSSVNSYAIPEIFEFPATPFELNCQLDQGYACVNGLDWRDSNNAEKGRYAQASISPIGFNHSRFPRLVSWRA